MYRSIYIAFYTENSSCSKSFNRWDGHYENLRTSAGYLFICWDILANNKQTYPESHRRSSSFQILTFSSK